MNPKVLIRLAALLALLLVIVVIREWMRDAPSLEQQVGLTPLAPADVAAEDIDKIELWAGAKPDEKVILVRDGDDWRVRTHFDAPARQEDVDTFIEDLLGLRGEFRDRAPDEALRERYEIGTDAAFHVAAYAGTGDEAEVHVLFGRAPDFRTVFVRRAGGDEIYVEQTNLRREAGVFSDDTEAVPEADNWLDMTVLDLEQAALERITLQLPDKAFALAKQAVESETDGAEGEGAATVLTPAEFKWVLADTATGVELKEQGLQNLLNKAASLTATDIVDPGELASYGLDTPAYRIELAVADEDDVVLEAGRPDTEGPGYLRVAGAEPEVVYELSTFNFEQLFPAGETIFELPRLALDTADMQEIRVASPDSTVTLSKGDSGWSVVAPAFDLSPQTATLSGAASTLANWQPVDVALGDVDAGPFDTAITVTLDGTTRQITLGAEALHVDGRYARLDGEDLLLVMGQADLDAVLLTPRDVYTLSLFDYAEDEVAEVVLRLDEVAVSFNRDDDTWFAVDAAGRATVDSEAMQSLLTDLVTLQASDLRSDQARFDASVWGTIALSTEAGETRALTLGPDEGGTHLLGMSGTNAVLELDASEAAGLRTQVLQLLEGRTLDEAPAAAAAPPAGAPNTPDLAPVLEVVPNPEL